MKEHYEKLSKSELYELDALLTKLMLYLHSKPNPPLQAKIHSSSSTRKKIPSDEELLRRF